MRIGRRRVFFFWIISEKSVESVLLNLLQRYTPTHVHIHTCTAHKDINACTFRMAREKSFFQDKSKTRPHAHKQPSNALMYTHTHTHTLTHSHTHIHTSTDTDTDTPLKSHTHTLKRSSFLISSLRIVIGTSSCTSHHAYSLRPHTRVAH